VLVMLLQHHSQLTQIKQTFKQRYLRPNCMRED